MTARPGCSALPRPRGPRSDLERAVSRSIDPRTPSRTSWTGGIPEQEHRCGPSPVDDTGFRADTDARLSLAKALSGWANDAIIIPVAVLTLLAAPLGFVFRSVFSRERETCTDMNNFNVNLENQITAVHDCLDDMIDRVNVLSKHRKGATHE